jgi:hypothetical protein
MKNILSSLVIIFFLVLGGCSTKKGGADYEVDGEVNDIPKWVYEPGSTCSKSKLCASAEGDSFSVSDAKAKKNLASMFETQISSNFSVQTTSFESSSEKDELSEKIVSEVEETVSEVLKAVEIEKRFSKDGVFFSLVTIDKRKFGKELKQEVNKINDEMEFLYEAKKKTAYKKLVYLSEKRHQLNEKYILLTGRSLPSKVKHEDVLAFRYIDAENSFVKIISEGSKRKLSAMLKEVLTESGYQITEDNNYNYGVYFDLQEEEAFMNVRGFVKYKYILKMRAKDNMQKEVGAFEISTTVSGRTQQDTWIKARPKLVDEVKKNIHKLNI